MSEYNKSLDDIDTYVSQIQRSRLFNIVVEGKDDLIVYKEFETIYEDYSPLVDVLPVQGRKTVLGIFDRLKNTIHIKRTIFIVDKDSWVLTQVDPNYQHEHIICTTGYSFENDIFYDGNLDKELIKRCPKNHHTHLNTLLTWYALEVDRIQNQRPTVRLDMSPTHLFDPKFTSSYTNPEAGEVFNTNIFNTLHQHYPLLLRGKTLLSYYVYILNMKPGLGSVHRTRAVIDNVASNKGNCLNRIFSEVDDLYKKLTA